MNDALGNQDQRLCENETLNHKDFGTLDYVTLKL